MRNFIRNILALVIAIGLLAIPFLVIKVGYWISYVGDIEEIQQLHSDMDKLDDPISSDVVGQATAWNQTIRRMQAYNSMWWGDPFVPDEWDDVSLLPIATDEEELEEESEEDLEEEPEEVIPDLP